jgi:predicted DCC family thiol-disulfide oxidoreductase YuxK
MNLLYILYDADCGICRRFRDWLEAQPAYVTLRFIPLQFEEGLARFQGLDRSRLRDELHVITEDGAVYRGSSAWIMCLYALVEYRTWACHLAQPTWRPWVQKMCYWISENRFTFSNWLKLRTPAAMEKAMKLRQMEPSCADLTSGRWS